MTARSIELRGVSVHNLKAIDLDLPHRQLIAVCGVSGSGKTSLALDTLYAEGQRRYIETFSAYVRQFLERLDKPEAERIDHLPPAIAVTHKSGSRSSRSTIGTATETAEYLRLLFAKIGQLHCLECGRPVRRDTPQSAADELSELPAGVRLQVAFRRAASDVERAARALRQLQEDGFVRVAVDGRTARLDGGPIEPAADGPWPRELLVILDRLTAAGDAARLRESLEAAFSHGGGRADVLVADPAAPATPTDAPADVIELDGARWQRRAYSTRLVCEPCGRAYPEPEPRLFSFNSPLGACATCEGFGNVIDIDMELVVPDPSKSIREGAIAPWNTPAYVQELDNLLQAAPAAGIRVDVPFSELSEDEVRQVREGLPQTGFGGLRGFFAWLERRKYKMHLRVFLSRWRSYHTCADCGGSRLRPEALAVRIGERSIADVCRMRVDAAREFFRCLKLPEWQRQVGRMMLEQVESRLRYLDMVGLGYLSLDRTLRTLSGGEAQRVALTTALGSSLVNMLYVLDEPSVGLHPSDVDRLIRAIQSLRDRGNTVVVVEHEEEMLRAADQLVEIGPGAGHGGGRVVFQGTLEAMLQTSQSVTGDFLAGRRGLTTPERRRAPERGWIRLAGARGNNLKNITVEFPLGVLCLVTGVSGSGKSTLVQDTLYPALCRRKRKDAAKPRPFDDVFGDGQIDDVVLIDQSPIGRSPRSNPVTYIKAFDEIRQVFAETVEARTHNYSASHFSFNVDGGRCTACRGDGFVEIDMQFLADVYMKCSQCKGTRYRDEILQVTYRGRHIAEVLDMTIREAFSFFRGQGKVQTKLKRLIDVGLDYLRLGQPANTLSTGEAQRLKLASYMSQATRNRTLFLLDEPTTGLHFADVVQLQDCFDALLAVGHSLIAVEHNLQLIKAADYLIDLGPGAGDDGGQVVIHGTPEQLAQHPSSATGRALAQALARELQSA